MPRIIPSTSSPSARGEAFLARAFLTEFAMSSSTSTSSDRFNDALHLFFMELAEVDAWYRDLKTETDKAALKRQALITTLRSAIETLPVEDRPTPMARLRKLVGETATIANVNGIPRRTDRTSIVRDWLREEAPERFDCTDLRAHLLRRGHVTRANYVGTLLSRFAKRGIVERVAMGRYRVNRDHPELAPTGVQRLQERFG